MSFEGACDQAEIFSVKYPVNFEQNVTMWVKRFRNEGKPSVVLSHAFCLSSNSLESLGKKICQQGFDVWLPNMRGHGRSSYKTLVSGNRQGSYSFDRIVSEDWDFLVDYILSKTKKKKISVIGHSIGGMSWEQYLSGVYKKGVKVFQSDEVSFLRAKKVSHFIGITVPPDFEKLSSWVRRRLWMAYLFTKSQSCFLPLTFGREYGFGMFGENEFVKKILWKSSDLSFFICRSFLPSGVMESHNLDRDYDEFYFLYEHALSSPHTDIVKDFLDWIYLDPSYMSRFGNIHYGMNKKVNVPTLMVTAGKDELAPKDRIISSFQKNYPDHIKKQIVNFEAASHIDIIFEKFQDALVSRIVNFIRSD